jgi:DNA replication protein DnaC
MTCQRCEGTGWAPVEVDGVRRMSRCECWRESLTARLLAEARIPPRYQRCELSSFTVYPNERLMNAVARARKFANEFPVADRGLFFVGPPGIGKSHLAVSVLKHVIRRTGARGIFYDVRELLRLIRSTYNPVVKAAEMDVLQPVMDADLLVLDDLGAEKASEWVDETLNLIVNHRYSAKRLTIFTSNYEEKEDQTDLDSLAVRVGFRMHSRLYEMCEFLEFDGADYRHRPPNAGPDDLLTMWKTQRRPKLPSRAARPVRAQVPEHQINLKWPGGRAGT